MPVIFSIQQTLKLFFCPMGNTMEGCVPAICIDQFKAKLKEGSVYAFEMFMVADIWRKYKITDYPYKIKITRCSKTLKKLSQQNHLKSSGHIQ
jgi:hypothetical protein